MDQTPHQAPLNQSSNAPVALRRVGPRPRRGKPAEAGSSLRLVGQGSARRKPQYEPIAEPTDPRWVLALRTAEQLQGVILPPEKRQRLLGLGRLMGLTPFDANLIIAIVQDQARRGYAPEDCPTAGEPQLRMIPLRKSAGPNRLWVLLAAAGALFATELLVLLVWLW